MRKTKAFLIAAAVTAIYAAALDLMVNCGTGLLTCRATRYLAIKDYNPGNTCPLLLHCGAPNSEYCNAPILTRVVEVAE